MGKVALQHVGSSQTRDQTRVSWIGFPGGASGEESPCNMGDPGLVPGLGRSPGEGNGNPLRDPCLENSMDRGAWQAMVHGITKSWTQLSTLAHTYTVAIKGIPEN